MNNLPVGLGVVESAEILLTDPPLLAEVGGVSYFVVALESVLFVRLLLKSVLLVRRGIITPFTSPFI